MATPFPFTSGQVLTAAQMNAITELVVNDKTASYTLVAGDAGERVIMNSASATTITVNTSIFTAGQLVYITNKGAGVCTVTAGTATVSTTGSLALAQFASGVLYCISAGVFIFEAYGVAASAGGLQFISAATFTAASTVSLATNTFTATYRNYRVIYNITSGSTDITISGRLRAAGSDLSGSNYNTGYIGRDNGGTVFSIAEVNQSSAQLGVGISSGGINQSGLIIDFLEPQLSDKTIFATQGYYQATSAGFAGWIQGGGLYNVATAADSFTIICSAGNITGTVRVYGYADS